MVIMYEYVSKHRIYTHISTHKKHKIAINAEGCATNICVASY